jgi:mono/diheme cytochrome c family protein
MSKKRIHLAVALLITGSLCFVRAQEVPLPASSAAADRDKWSYDELEKAPEKARARLNPLEKNPKALPAGRILFEDHCAECHGPSAEGSKKAPSLRAPQVQSATPGTLFWVLTNGVVRRGMPVWSRLPEPQRWQLVRYLKSLGVAPQTAFPEVTSPVDAGAGPTSSPPR